MDLNELIAAVKAASTKAALESLVKAELGIDIDRRKTLDALRGEVLVGLGAPVETAGETPAEQPEPAPEPVQPVEPVSEITAAPAAPSTAPALPVELPPLDTPIEQPPIPPRQRLLRNRVTGHVLIWTQALDGHPDLDEA